MEFGQIHYTVLQASDSYFELFNTFRTVMDLHLSAADDAGFCLKFYNYANSKDWWWGRLYYAVIWFGQYSNSNLNYDWLFVCLEKQIRLISQRCTLIPASLSCACIWVFIFIYFLLNCIMIRDHTLSTLSHRMVSRVTI